VLVVLVVALIAACGTSVQSLAPSSGGTPGQSSAELPAPSSSPTTPIVGVHTLPIGATATVDDGAWLIADRLAAPAYSADSTAALVDGLARSGIGTYVDPSSTVPEETVAGTPSAFQLLDFQVHALAVGAWTGSTFSGAELDGILPTPAGDTVMPTTSDVLAAYVAAADSPGASLSRALMAGQNLLSPSTTQFPAIVLVLFASDLATDGGRIGSPIVAPSSSPVALRYGTTLLAMANTGTLRDGSMAAPAASGGVCTNTSNWIQNTIHSLFNALKQATPDNRPGVIVASVWKWLVTQDQPLVTGLLSAVTNAALGTIRSIAGAISAVAIQIASLLPYGLKVLAVEDSGGAVFRLGPEPLTGSFTVYVTAGDLPDWPPVLADCASVAQVALWDFHPKNIPLTWGPLQSPPDPKLAPDSSAKIDDLTDDNGQATWGFTTSTDPGDSSTEEQDQVDSMAVHVHRPDVEAARQHLTDALMGSIPGILQPFVTSLFAPYVNGLQASLNKLLDLRGSGAALLIYHKPPKPTPSPPTTPAPSGECSPSPVPPGSYPGTYSYSATITGADGVVDQSDGSGAATLSVAPDGSVSGSWGAKVHETVNTQDDTYTLSGGSFTGTACDLITSAATVTLISCTTGGHGDCHFTTGGSTGRTPAVHLGPPASGTTGTFSWQLKRDVPGVHVTIAIAVGQP